MREPYCTIGFEGPFRWFGSGDALFDQDVARSPGIYLWTVPHDSSYLTYYVGETGRSFGERMKEHAGDYLSGMYRIFDPIQFAAGRKVLIWDGMWRRGEERRLGEFVARLPELSVAVGQLLDCMRLFVGPLDASQRTRRRIEAALAKHLYGQSSLVGSFQDEDITYEGRLPEENPLNVRFCASADILGLAESIEA
jgi:hypothetical protein